MRWGWSLERGDWVLAQNLLVTASGEWKLARYEALAQDSVPTGPGVYMFSVDAGELLPAFPRIHNIVYIGKARSLRSRFLQHCREPAEELRRARTCFGQDAFRYHCIETQSFAETESVLIACFGPIVNRISGARIGAAIQSPVRA